MSLQKIELVRFPETDSEELREYKKKVYEVARRVQDEETWCQDGFNAAMNDLDIPMAVVDDGWVRVRLEAGPLILTFEMNPEDLDGKDLDEQLEALVTSANDLSFYAHEDNSEATISIRVAVEDVTYIGLVDDEKPSSRDNVWGVHPFSASGAKSHLFVGSGISGSTNVISACGSVVAWTRSLKPDDPNNRCMNCSKSSLIN